MSDAWSDIQALKNKQSSLREKLAQRKKQRQEVVAEIIGTPSAVVVRSGAHVCVTLLSPYIVLTACVYVELCEKGKIGSTCIYSISKRTSLQNL